MRESYQTAQKSFLSIHQEAFGPLAKDVLMTRRFFSPESIRNAVDREISGARVSEDARRNVEIRHLSKLAESQAERFQFGNLKWQTCEDVASDYCEQKAEKVEKILTSYCSGEIVPDWLQKQSDAMAINPFTFFGFFQFDQCRSDIEKLLIQHDLDEISLRQTPQEILADLLRITNKDWWFRQWRKRYARLVDEVARSLGHVKKARSPYVSKKAHSIWKKRQFQNYEFMKSTSAENDAGQSFDLHELAMRGTANRAIRRTELMTRLRGFEILADLQGYKAEFWTITCPSRFHPTTSRKTRNGKKYAVENKNWVDADRPTVREAQSYLCGVWSRIRADLKRRGIDWFGFRIAEPHGDGCPHWHLVVYVPANTVCRFGHAVFSRDSHGKNGGVVLGSVARTGRKHALTDCPNERGADKHRFTVEPIKSGINPETGREYSATGYVAKYISKNIDGYGVEGLEDFDGGGDLKNNAKKVVSWASIHGIRQFQQFGGAPVGIWRELRRLHSTTKEEDRDEFLVQLFEQTEQEDAAEAWAAFCLIHAANPDRFTMIYEHTIAPVIRMNWDLEKPNTLKEFKTKRVVLGRFGAAIMAPTGIEIDRKRYCTRPHSWTLQRKTIEPPVKIEPADWSVLMGMGEARPNLDLCH